MRSNTDNVDEDDVFIVITNYPNYIFHLRNKLQRLRKKKKKKKNNNFQAVNLPVENPDVRASTESRKPTTQNANTGAESYSYVQLTPMSHDYMYPVIDEHKCERTERRNSTGSLKKTDIIVTQPKKNSGQRGNVRMRCKHCQEIYTEEQNPKGSCEFAPDRIRHGIDTVSCLLCAQCMLYHCMSDAEGEFVQNPCR